MKNIAFALLILLALVVTAMAASALYEAFVYKCNTLSATNPAAQQYCGESVSPKYAIAIGILAMLLWLAAIKLLTARRP